MNYMFYLRSKILAQRPKSSHDTSPFKFANFSQVFVKFSQISVWYFLLRYARSRERTRWVLQSIKKAPKKTNRE